MKKNTIYKLMIVIILILITFIFAKFDNEAIFPSTLVGILLILTFFRNENTNKTSSEKAAQKAIIVYSVLVMVANTMITIFLPIISASSDLSGFSVELTTGLRTTNTKEIANHFVEVIMNDMHELCYFTMILLIINLLFILTYRFKVLKKATI